MDHACLRFHLYNPQDHDVLGRRTFMLRVKVTEVIEGLKWADYFAYSIVVVLASSPNTDLAIIAS